ncbi:nuclear protein 1 [Vombatus ursinus]|uniref:Nuclear protein 1, transcriptional regulator n=1 Tax=Vombatus ursinus TaxID=29139 RepID=A0A4X2KGD2_VOMUR|nr:nuclear protein 1 [Vombatus ursinus]
MATAPLPSPPLQPLTLEDEEPECLDQYDIYSFTDSYLGRGSGKGRTKREAANHTNRHSPGGHERKLLTKLQNTEQKKRGTRP